MYITEILSRLIEHYSQSNDDEIYNCYIVDEAHEFKEELVKTSENIIFFKNSLITTEDLATIKEKLDKAYKVCKNIAFLCLFLNPTIVEEIIKNYPEINFYPIYHSNLLNVNIKKILDEQFSDNHSFNSDLLDSESMCRVFRKKMLNYIDEY